jgi:phasin family protein
MTNTPAFKAKRTTAKTPLAKAKIVDAVAAPDFPAPIAPAPSKISPTSAINPPLPKEPAMSNFPAFDFAAPFQTAFADMQEKTKAAFEKSSGMFGDYTEFAKGNVEAMVEAGKILAAGLQDMTTAMVADSRATFESLTAEAKELAAAKSPTDFLKLQNDLAKKHFDEVVASTSKGSEALMKLASEAAQPISSRVSLAVEKVKTAA